MDGTRFKVPQLNIRQNSADPAEEGHGRKDQGTRGVRDNKRTWPTESIGQDWGGTAHRHKGACRSLQYIVISIVTEINMKYYKIMKEYY